MYDIVGKRRWYYLFSALITIPGLFFVLIGGLKPSIDFTGFSVLTLQATRVAVFSLQVATREPRWPMILPEESMYCVPPTCAFIPTVPAASMEKAMWSARITAGSLIAVV